MAVSARVGGRCAAIALLGLLATLPLSGVTAAGGPARALAEPRAGEVTPQSDASLPAHEVVMLGSSPGEAPAETWGIGKVGAQSEASFAIVRYTAETGWTIAPQILGAGGEPLSGFKPAESPLAGAIDPDGSGALLGEAPVGGELKQTLLVRKPGQPFTATAGSPVLEAHERLYDASGRRAPLLAALEEGSGSTGALVAPVGASSETSVLHWSAGTQEWTSEPIEIPAASKSAGGFQVLAIAASSPTDAWLLARLQTGSEAIGLFRRIESGGAYAWQPVAPDGGEPGAPLQVPVKSGSTALVEPGNAGLTVTSQGVWIDGDRADTLTPITMFLKPEGAAAGTVAASWCAEPSSEDSCTHTLSESLPTRAYRSFAWADPSTPFGERVITGLGEGVSLRLEGEEFARVLALGSSATVDVGASHGAAFSSDHEGWLGSASLPVHLTMRPQANQLETYPTPFRHPLLAIVPQPGAPVGALTSEALAVGEAGEVARFVPGAGWEPESLLDVAGVRQTPQLRAVAWPRPARAYAVGTAGQMWLWRGETGLWEKDPATPVNFRGDLLGIAFDPANPSRGYAVGQGGVLLRYGKTWTQERTCGEGVAQPCLPAEVAGASFTSIAFAGSEAIVAFRVPHFSFNGTSSVFSYTGGLLVDAGSGWTVDAAAASALAGEANNIPWAVAGLPDGGAALSTESGLGVPRVLERNGPGQLWESTAEPYPGFSAPGALALFREGGALRVIGSGNIPDTAHFDEQTPAPAGFPPALVRPYPLPSAPAFLLRQTANGWSEQEHDHDEAGPPQGSYKLYDKGYEPDPTWAVEIGPAGEAGWAVGGFPKGESGSAFETADIARYAYPAPETAPALGQSLASVPREADTAAFAIGGGAQCGAPCAARARADIGPDTWLSTALEQAARAGAEDFLYTGPRLTTGATLVKATLEVPYAEEFARYAELRVDGEAYAARSGGEMHIFPAASATDRVHGEECLFKATLPQFFPTGCAAGEPARYAFSARGAQAGENVRVIMLDDSSAVEAGQLEWLSGELAAAGGAGEPAIVVGNADLNAQYAHNEGNAAAVVAALVAGKASAYFFYAPEQNIRLLLPDPTLPGGVSAIPAYGSGTLGYVSFQTAELPEFIGASGFLLGQVGQFSGAARSEAGRPNARVSVELIPNIGAGDLSLEARQGTLLQRSRTASFAALARRPRAGNEASGESESENLSYVFTPIPADCVGADCAEGILPEYSFTSSDETIGRFVKPELHSAQENAVKYNAKTGQPEFEGGATPATLSGGAPYPSASGLFCALNPGPTTITISTGGYAASVNVTVQEGSVRQPCGTTAAKPRVSRSQEVPAPAPPPPAPVPAATPAAAPPLLPVPPPPAAAPAPPRPVRVPTLPTPFFLQPANTFLAIPFVPPPLPAPANPTPPSGTSAVTSPVEAAQKEEEQEEATESVSNQAVAYRAPEREPPPVYLLGLIVLAAFAGASGVRRRPRTGRRELSVAPATISSSRAQRNMQQTHRRR